MGGLSVGGPVHELGHLAPVGGTALCGRVLLAGLPLLPARLARLCVPGRDLLLLGPPGGISAQAGRCPFGVWLVAHLVILAGPRKVWPQKDVGASTPGGGTYLKGTPAGRLRLDGLTLAGVNIELTGRFLGDPGQRGGFLVLAGLLGGFLFIRTSARMIRAQVSWWPGNVQTGSGLHIHHLVWGIVTVMLTGFLAFALEPDSPWREVLAVLFGIGCGLTLDEFALWLHLEDVYWAKEGRSSVDAVIVAVLLGGLVVVGAAPFDTGQGGSIAAISAAVAFNLVFVVLAVAKGKRFTALVSVFVPLFGMVGAVRLARPGSRWATLRYPPQSRKAEESKRRDVRLRRTQNRLLNLIAGTPSGERSDT